jgi:uncharacterized membrane protein (DUF373 family)
MTQNLNSSTDEPGVNPDGRLSSPADSVPHTQLHTLARRALEHAQDAIAFLLMVFLLALALQTLWRLARLAFVEAAPTNHVLSEIIFVLILMELYRLLIYYLREHRVSVVLTVEVALISTLQELMLKGAHEFEWHRLLAISLLLAVLGGLLVLERWGVRWQHETSETDAR